MEPSIKAIILRVVHLDSVIPVLGYLDEPIDEYANGVADGSGLENG